MIQFIKFDSELEFLPIHTDGEKYYVQVKEGVNAGFPSPAEDFLNDRISLDELYLSKVEATFVNRVKGLSMYPDYQENDILILRSDYEPQHGDDVVVSINSSAYTLKRYDKMNSKLVALNPNYAHSVVITESDEVVILGVVDALVRNIKKRR
ncbi:LexA family protein [Paenimyroides aestuarii]|uniref:DNA repair protein n=1 Tax=Paenimyroides aestuarii TaxID=2968490 RepID=A0ABY5NTT9_9FLAO|nr:S24 family peptidase [Paenimyroides aestuarii]UUV21996.1 DNA repair protein [Paenimyroides aestuarii]